LRYGNDQYHGAIVEAMIVMVSNNSSGLVHYLAGKHPDRIGWLMGPSSWKKPRPWLPYAVDNDAFISWTNQQPWDPEAWRKMLGTVNAAQIKPRWVLVPDVVADRKATIESWKRYAPEAAETKCPLAFAVQDGMTPDDVPPGAQVIFIGGSTEWKWNSLTTWSTNFKRVHVGRVNTARRLNWAEAAGVESVDGSGWFRATEDGKQASDLTKWLAGFLRDETPLLFPC
jgi:hypothetical protein